MRVAAGDVTGDGKVDIITGPADETILPIIRIFDSTSGNLMSSFQAYDTSFKGGVYVSAGDVTGDGTEDIITGAGAGGGPHIKVFSGNSGGTLGDFFAFDAGFKGGVPATVADMDGDGKAEIVATQGKGKSLIKIFNPNTFEELARTTAFPQTFSGGVFVGSAPHQTPGPSGTATPSSGNLPDGSVSFIDALVLKDISTFTLDRTSDACGLNSTLTGSRSGNNLVISNIPGNSLITFSFDNHGQYSGSNIIILSEPSHNGSFIASGCDVTLNFTNSTNGGQCQSKFHYSPPVALRGLLNTEAFATCP